MQRHLFYIFNQCSSRLGFTFELVLEWAGAVALL
jgi:hypothetical protein